MSSQATIPDSEVESLRLTRIDRRHSTQSRHDSRTNTSRYPDFINDILVANGSSRASDVIAISDSGCEYLVETCAEKCMAKRVMIKEMTEFTAACFSRPRSLDSSPITPLCSPLSAPVVNSECDVADLNIRDDVQAEREEGSGSDSFSSSKEAISTSSSASTSCVSTLKSLPCSIVSATFPTRKRSQANKSRGCEHSARRLTSAGRAAILIKAMEQSIRSIRHGFKHTLDITFDSHIIRLKVRSWYFLRSSLERLELTLRRLRSRVEHHMDNCNEDDSSCRTLIIDLQDTITVTARKATTLLLKWNIEVQAVEYVDKYKDWQDSATTSQSTRCTASRQTDESDMKELQSFKEARKSMIIKAHKTCELQDLADEVDGVSKVLKKAFRSKHS